MKYRVQDLAQYNREVIVAITDPLEGESKTIKFDGHYAIIDEVYIDSVRNKTDFQISQETGNPIPTGVTTESLVKEPIKEVPKVEEKPKKKGKK